MRIHARKGRVSPIVAALVVGHICAPTLVFAQDGGVAPSEDTTVVAEDAAATETEASPGVEKTADTVEPAETAEAPAVDEGKKEGESDSDAAARAAYLRGRTLFEEQHYEESAKAFDEAYRLSKRPLLLLSIASAQERAGQFDDALQTLRTYQPYADATNAGEVEYRIAALEDRMSTFEERQSDEPEDATTETVAAAPVEKSTNWAGWATTGVGALAVGTGVTFMLLGDMDHQDVADSTTREEAQELIDSGDQKKLIGYVATGVGGAALVTGIVLLATGVGAGDAEPETTTAWSISPTKDGGYVSFLGRF